MKHVLVCKVENKPGVLNRISSLFRRRLYNIDSLTVSPTENPAVSRMTIVVDATRTDARIVERNLYKLVNTIEVKDVTDLPAVKRDLALIKVHTNPDTRSEVLNLVDIFRGKVVDVAPSSVIIELTGEVKKIDSFIEVLKEFGIAELVRTGLVAMERGRSDKEVPAVAAAQQVNI
ncbi:MAG: acetolactate synthase small subunit [Candidatus Schekmanbacteria bacterium]|nr:acetolactate synthase small subunit [Candidatus Schekmanbacteria bacterium]